MNMRGATCFLPYAMLNLLVQTIQQTEALIGAVEASISETKQNWNLP